MSEPPSDDTIRERLLKVLRLAQEGVGGERDNATALLDKLLVKHGMTMADLEAASGSARSVMWIDASDDDERTVLSQLGVRLFGLERTMWRRAGETGMGIDVSSSEHAALTIAWEVYRAAFAEARQALVLGFCYKHGLFASEGGDANAMSVEARARAARAMAMAETLPVVESPARRVGAGDG